MRYWMLAVLAVGVGVIEITSLSSVLPFLSVVANPETITENAYLRRAYELFEFDSPLSFSFMLGFLVLGTLIARNFVAGLHHYGLIRLTYRLADLFSARLMGTYLGQDYEFFLTQNGSELAKNVLLESKNAVQYVIIPVNAVIGKLIIVLLIIALLVLLNPLMALLSAAVVGGSYLLIYLLFRRTLHEIGTVRFHSNKGRFRNASEAMKGVKEIKALGKEKSMLRQFERVSSLTHRAEARHQSISQIPKYFQEVFILGGIVVLALVYIAVQPQAGRVLPLLGVYAYASFRLKPIMNELFQRVSNIRTHHYVLRKMLEHSEFTTAHTPHDGVVVPLPFRENITVKDIHFAYPLTESPTIADQSLVIDARTTIGFVGSTGSGKTTLVDIILGLLRPQKGELLIDGISITPDNLQRWQANVGYVPQVINIFDDTIARNIAFGVEAEAIDDSKLRHCAHKAHLHDFIESELELGYDTVVGDQGIRLSGGQRQRIGIARALYREPQVLIFDEATSALDTITEQTILDAIHSLNGENTIIMIAHRTGILRNCHCIYVMGSGRIIASGTYNELLEHNDQFRALSQAGM